MIHSILWPSVPASLWIDFEQESPAGSKNFSFGQCSHIFERIKDGNYHLFQFFSLSSTLFQTLEDDEIDGISITTKSQRPVSTNSFGLFYSWFF
jgi:hypothetical protein